MVFVGVRLGDWKYVGGPDEELSWPSEEKILGAFCDGAQCELSWLKARADEMLQAAARGNAWAVNRCLGARTRPEAVEANERVRDAIVRVGGKQQLSGWGRCPTLLLHTEESAPGVT
jgi:hypothetical protein